jgi:hypothetical protein
MVLSNVPPDVSSFLGEPVCVGRRNRSTKFLTLTIHAANFRGLLELEGTLVTQPSRSDWFPVIAPLRYPRVSGAIAPNPAFVTGSFEPIVSRRVQRGLISPFDPYVGSAALGETSVLTVSIKLDLVWVRAKITRGEPWTAHPELQSPAITYGTIDKIVCI